MYSSTYNIISRIQNYTKFHLFLFDFQPQGLNMLQIEMTSLLEEFERAKEEEGESLCQTQKRDSSDNRFPHLGKCVCVTLWVSACLCVYMWVCVIYNDSFSKCMCLFECVFVVVWVCGSGNGVWVCVFVSVDYKSGCMPLSIHQITLKWDWIFHFFSLFLLTEI